MTDGLHFDERGKAHRWVMDKMAQIAAETLSRYLDRSGFVGVIKRSPPKPHSTPKSGCTANVCA